MKPSYSNNRDESTPEEINLSLLKDRVRAERERLGFRSPRDYAASAGIALSVYYRYEAGGSLPSAISLSQFLKSGMDICFILSGVRVGTLIPTSENDSIRIPLMEAQPSAGSGSFSDDGDMVKSYMELSLAWARSNIKGQLECIRILSCKGDSMSGTIEDGDLMFVDTSIRQFDGEGIYVLQMAGVLLVKRIAVDLGSNQFCIISDNARYAPKLVNLYEMDQIFFCGRVRHWLRMMKG